ncbi:MAG: ribokinase [Tateyamaria sp.]|jgi:ribokinase|nr:ribokinase [Tateyamaria sp.]
MHAYVIGNIVMDETFQVDALPKEGESILGTRKSRELGGKGANQAVVLARCDVPTTLIAGVGADEQAKRIRQALTNEPIDARLLSLPNCDTDQSIVLADRSGRNSIVTTVDCAQAMAITDITPLLRDANRDDHMILQGNLTPKTTAALFDEADRLGLVTVFNPSPVDITFKTFLKRANIIFLNAREAEQLTGYTGQDAVEALVAKGANCVVLTMGSDGALFGRDNSVEAIPAQPAVVTDATGAGDAYQSTAIAAAMRRGKNIDASDLKCAAVASALTVSRFGTISAFPNVDEFKELLSISPT